MADPAAPSLRPGRRLVFGPPPPRPVTARQRSRRDFPDVPGPVLDLAERLSSPLLLGPPLCEELVALVRHTFTEEEAACARHLNGALGLRAADVARAEHRPVAEVAPLLERMGIGVSSITAEGPAHDRRYKLQPIMPGIFELVLMNQSAETITPWHRRFAELFEALYETGYARPYYEHTMPVLRFLPLTRAVVGHPLALPSDQLEVVLDRYRDFALGTCMCRLAMKVVGRGCGKPLDNCLAMGEGARHHASQGRMKTASRQAVLDVKREAEAHGLVHWIINVESARGQACCSCCGCCCHAMRQVSEFDAPAAAAPPHFLPRFDRSRCTYCGACARVCPMGALSVEPAARTAWQQLHRCIGCGLCVLACAKHQAIALEPVPDYRLPPDSWFALITRSGPSMARGVLHAWWNR